MKYRPQFKIWLIILLTLALLTSAAVAAQVKGIPLLGATQNTADRTFTYQGSLQESGAPANGVYDFQFSLFDELTGGAQIGSTLTKTNVTVSDSLFTVQLNFGHAFDGSPRYLEIAARQGGAPSYDTLSPRQSLSPSPYAIHALQAGAVAEPGHTSTLVSYRGHGDPSPASHPAIIIGSDGFPIIAFDDDVGDAIRLIHCENLACTDYTTASISAVSHGWDGRISLRLAPDGMPYLTYVDNEQLNIRHCQDVACLQINYGTGPVGLAMVEAATLIGVDGLPIIAYTNTSGELETLHCTDLLCTNPYPPAFVDDDSREMRITAGPDGMPVIAYLADDGQHIMALKIARCEDRQCTAVYTQAVAGCGPDPEGLPLDCLAPSITTAHDGDVRVSFVNQEVSFGLRGDVTVLRCNWVLLPPSGPDEHVFCDPVIISELVYSYIDLTSSIDIDTAITIRDDNNHLVVFNSRDIVPIWGDRPSALGAGLAVLGGPNHGTLDTINFLDPAITDTDIAATVGVDDLPIIAYTDADSELTIIHCGNELCVPYFREP